MGDRQPEIAWVEGYDQDGKSLERIVNEDMLDRMHRQIKEHEVKLSKELREKRNGVEENQEELQKINQEYLTLKEDLEDFARKEKVELDSEQKSRIERTTKDTIDGFLAKQDMTAVNMEVEVDVHFLAEKDTTSETLHLGGEGAGSRDAKFIVSLESKVEDLAKQAAKYWGLDAQKVFFLDKDGRIVPDDMRMKEIVLPPAKKKSAESSSKAVEMWTVKGRNYSFNLVRAETVLKKEDLTSSNGVKWADFTFQEAKLEEELENTRKKYGDSGQVEATVNMDEIPSLYDLINKGKERKRRKRADTRCRILEFGIFCLVTVQFYWLLSPDDNFNFYMQMVNHGIKADFGNFTRAEAGDRGVDHFSKVSTPAQYEDWLRGPFARAAFGPDTDLRKRNIYVLTAFGVTYGGTPVNHSLAFCEGDASSVPNACYASGLKACANERAVRVYSDAAGDGHAVPACQERFTESMASAFVRSYEPENQFTLIAGYASTYVGGTKTNFNLTDRAGLDASLGAFLGGPQGPARLVNVIMYAPSLQGVAILQMLAENTMSGAYITHVKQSFVNAAGGQEYLYPVYLFVVVLAFVTFLMELRRILGRPQRWSFEDHRDPFSCWTLVFFLLPFAVLATFVLVSFREQQSAADKLITIDRVTANGYEISPTSLERINEISILDIYVLRLKLIILITINTMLFRYLLMFFPQLSFLAQMVGKMVKPILTTLCFLLATLGSLGVLLYFVYGGKFVDFRNVHLGVIQALRMTMGGSEDWYQLYLASPAVFLTVEILAFLLICILLNYMTLAIMVSHKREKDLHENSGFHPFWTAERVKAANDPRGFNPSVVGEDFRKKRSR